MHSPRTDNEEDSEEGSSVCCQVLFALGFAAFGVLLAGALVFWGVPWLRAFVGYEPQGWQRPTLPPETHCNGTLVLSAGRCICPPPLMLRRASPTAEPECVDPDSTQLMSFYMYRAQGPSTYPMENVNMADLPGLMWYLHNEVVSISPRHYGITRILRYKVTMRNPNSIFEAWKHHFGPFVAFDMAQCTAPGCADFLREHGAAIGCQPQNAQQSAYQPLPGSSPLCELRPHAFASCNTGIWYSVPGPCPEKSFSHKDAECIASNPGGSCEVVDGSNTCTYHMEFAGELSLDELEGIEDYAAWQRVPGHLEWDRAKDRGIGNSFWDGVKDAAKCARRQRRVLDLFARKYPGLPRQLPGPPCT